MKSLKAHLHKNFVCSMLSNKFNTDLHYYTFDRIRLSFNNLKKDGKIINIPLYLVEYIDNFI